MVKEQGLGEFSDELRAYTLNTGVMENEAIEHYKVWPTEFDQPHFRAIIDSGSFAELSNQYPILKKQRLTGTPRLIQAYVFFFRSIDSFLKRALVSEHLQSQPIVVERVKALFGTFKDNLQIVSIELEGQDDPQVIFETLNARGERLLPSDLLRNYLFWRASKEGAEVSKLYQRYWRPFDTDFWKLEEKQGRLKRPRVDLFFFNLLQLKTGREVNIGRLYYEYKGWSESTASTSIDHELSEIHRYSTELEKLLRPSGDTALGRFAQVLQVFDVKTIFPLAMKLLADGGMEEEELSSILVDFESYLVRRQVCGLTSQGYNQVFVNWIRRLDENGGEFSQVRLRDIMQSEQANMGLWPDDNRFWQA